jgi:hypothetical protein
MPVFGNSIPFWFHGTFLSTSWYWPLFTIFSQKGPLARAKGTTGMRRASQLAILLQLAVSSTIWCYLPRRGGQERNARCKWPAYYGGQHQNSGLVGRTLEGPCRLPSLQIARMEPRQSRRKHYAACKRCSGTQHSKLSPYHRWVQNLRARDVFQCRTDWHISSILAPAAAPKSSSKYVIQSDPTAAATSICVFIAPHPREEGIRPKWETAHHPSQAMFPREQRCALATWAVS